jgi:hypothetical protein
MSMNNDAYAAALAEIEEGRLDKGAWARAFAESGGEESKAKALYIKSRAKSIEGSPAWPDTQPPVGDLGQKRVEPESSTGKAVPESNPTEYYEAALGEKNSDYYIGKFHAFDEMGSGFHASWNWAAFFFTGFWSLYRKMYGWFFAWCFFGTVGTTLMKVPNPQIQQGVGIAYIASFLGFTVFANALYHRRIKARIAAAKDANLDAARVNMRLSSGAGVHTWVAYIFGGLPVVGIVAAIALPAYQDLARPQEPSAKYSENDIPVPQGVAAASTSRSQIDDFLQEKPSSIPASPDASPYVYNRPAEPAEPASPSPTLRVLPPIVSDYQRAETLAFEAKERAKNAKIDADLKEATERALQNYPYLGTPAGEEDLKKIVAKRDEMIEQGVYPALALTRAVLAVAAYK